MLYFLVSVVVGYFLLKELWMRWNYDLHKIPCPPKVPFFGHVMHFTGKNKSLPMNLWVQQWRARLGFPKVMKMSLTGRTMIFLTDATIVRNVLLSKPNQTVRGGPSSRHFHRLLMGDDPTPLMFTTPATTPYVKAIRRCYAASFTTAGMKQALYKHIEVMKTGKLYLEGKKGQDTIDIQDFFTRLMLDVSGKVQFDMDFGGLNKSSPLCDSIIGYTQSARSLAANPLFELQTKLFPNSKLAQKINQNFNNLQSQWARIALEVHNRSEPDEEDVSFAANLKRVCLPGTTDPLPLNLLRGEIAFSIIAGFATTSHQLAWIFALLATCPHVVNKILDELKTHGLYGNNVRQVEFEDLSELKYLTAVVKEGMRRIHTVVSVSARTATRDLMLDGYRVPKGAVLLIPGNSSTNSEMEWEDHLEFQPERWLQDNTNVKEKYYFPFSLGERDCVGMKLAMQFMKVTIVYFISRFSFELVGDTIESLVQNGVVRNVFEAKNGINMKVTPRT